jgi:threonyl-tRNA synthetase
MIPLLYQLWGPDGERVSEDTGPELPEGLDATQAERGVLERMLGGQRRERALRAVEVRRNAERLEFVSAEGCVPGFFNVLPRGIFLDRCIDRFNRQHAVALGAVLMEFPTVFDQTSAEIEELTRGYERDGRMFSLGPPDEGKRLSYAADPGLFNWLKGRVLAPERLPFTISSPLMAMRRWKSGELGDLDHLRQYPLSDLHILVTAADALPSYLFNTSLGAEGARFWAGEDWAVFADITAEFLGRVPGLGGAIARAAKKWTLVRVYPNAPRYYAMRSGIVLDAGYADVMLYNMQWDEENPQRFQIGVADGQPLVVLHGNMATGWPLLLPVLLGRAMSRLAPLGFPVEVAPVQVCVLPVAEQHLEAARAWMSQRPRLRARLLGPERPLRRRLREVHDSLCPVFMVIGDRDIASGGQLTYTTTREIIGGSDFPEHVRRRIERCTPETDPPVIHSPFRDS